MKYKVVEDADVVTYVVVCDPGDEAVAALAQFVRTERLELRRSPPSAPLNAPPSAGSTLRLSNTAASWSTSSARCCR
jgi:hypothetical protein